MYVLVTNHLLCSTDYATIVTKEPYNVDMQLPVITQLADKMDSSAPLDIPDVGEATANSTCLKHHENNTMAQEKNDNCAVVSGDVFFGVDRNCSDSRRSSLDECVYYCNDSNGRYEQYANIGTYLV